MSNDIPFDIDEFNKAVADISKKEKFVDKPKEYDINSFRKVVEKVFGNLNMRPELKERAITATFEMMKASKMFEHIAPDDLERVLTGFVSTDDSKKETQNNYILPEYDGSFEPFPPLRSGIDMMNNCFGPPPNKSGSVPSFDIPGLGGLLKPENAGNVADILGSLGSIFGNKAENNKMKLAGKVGESNVSIEIVDPFSLGLAKQVLEQMTSIFTKTEFEKTKGNVDKSAD